MKNFAVLVTLVVLGGCAAADSPTAPSVNDPPGDDSPPADTRPPLSGLTFATASTIFIGRQDANMQERGSLTQQFTLGSEQQFRMRYASDYRMTMAIIPPDQVDAFTNFDAAQAYYVWDGGAGVESVKLAAGTYVMAIRNPQTGSVGYSFELDYALSLQPEYGYSFEYSDTPILEAFSLDSGAYAWQGLTVQSGYRYFIDGTNVGAGAWIIPSDQLSAFQGGGSFQFLEGYGGDTGGMPGLWELKIPPGSYYLVARAENREAGGHITYEMEAWAIH